MQIVQAVYGVFHQFELAHQLERRGHLRRVYSTWPWARLKREGLARSYVRSFPLVHTADYFLGRTRFYSPAIAARFNEWNSKSFDWYTRTRIEECDALIAISGAALTTGPLVQSRGGKFICDRGSTHQRFQNKTMAAECKVWGVPFTADADHILGREEAIYAEADAITVPSSVARRSFVAMGVPADKVHVIPYGVRLDKFSKTEDPPSDTFEVLFAGQVSLRKGIPYLLEAFSQLKHPGKRLTVVGSVQDDVRSLLAKLPTENVTFLGSIPQSELAKRMSRSHVLVLPSVEEGLALVQGQAMACGCPVIATAATGAEDLFTDGVEGFILADTNVEALALRMQQLVEDPDLRQSMSNASLSRVATIGGWNRYGDLWENFLYSLTGNVRGNEGVRE